MATRNLTATIPGISSTGTTTDSASLVTLYYSIEQHSGFPGTWRFRDPFPALDLRTCYRYLARLVGLTLTTLPNGEFQLRDLASTVWTIADAIAASKITDFVMQEKRSKSLNT